jgi:hypothetical protein
VLEKDQEDKFTLLPIDEQEKILNEWNRIMSGKRRVTCLPPAFLEGDWEALKPLSIEGAVNHPIQKS